MNKLLSTVFLILLSSYSSACTFFPRAVEELYADADKVFKGSLISAEAIKDDEGYFNELKLTYIVEESFKGKVGEKEVVYSGFGRGDCGLGANFNISYLIYSHDSRASSSTGSHGLLSELNMDGTLEYRGRQKAIINKLRTLSGSNKSKQSERF